MSRADLVEEVTAAINARDIDRAADLMHPELEFFSRIASAEGTVFRGREGLHAWGREVHSIWEEFRIRAEDVREVGSALVVVYRVTGRARGSGVPVDQVVGQIWTFKDGKPWRNEAFAHPAEALAEAERRAAAP